MDLLTRRAPDAPSPAIGESLDMRQLLLAFQAVAFLCVLRASVVDAL